MAMLHPSNPFYDPWRRSHAVQPEPLIQFDNPKPQPPQRSKTESSNLATTSHQQGQLQQPRQAPRERNTVTYRTRSIGGPYGAGIIFERQIDLSPPKDDEIIIATVRVTDSFRRASVEGGTDLPSRPPPRSFLRRVSTRLSSSSDCSKYTAIKMPRRDYKRYFAKDREGKYVGTEPEREWTMEDLNREFGEYQDMPLRSIPGSRTYGEGESWVGGGEGCREVVVGVGAALNATYRI